MEGEESCKYYAPEELKCLNNPNKYSLLHLNIRSLNKHHSDLVTFLSNLGCSFDVIGCSETWLNDRSYVDILNLDGYNLYYKNRLGRTGGGTCIYLKSKYQVNVCDDLSIDDESFDSFDVIESEIL